MEPVYKTHTEALRQLLELAISCGRSWQSSQTGYIHYCYTLQDEPAHHPIPTYENFLFALALMRSRNIENINDAKTLISRLLHFQSKEGEMSGNFPIYLHDYPFCKDRLWGAHMLAPLHWIYKNFHHVLGNEIKEALKEALVNLLNYCLKTISEKKAPYQMALKIATCAKSIGIFLNEETIQKRGESLLIELHQHPDKSCWYSPPMLSELIIAFQMLIPSLPGSPEKDFWKHLTDTWHPSIGAYCGPGWKEYQQRKESQVTLYDYFMGYFSGGYSHRCFADHPVQLQAALLHPIEDPLPAFNPPEENSGMLNGLPWKMFKHSNAAYSVIAKQLDVAQIQEKTFAPFKLIWGSTTRMHSLICQGGSSHRIDFMATENQVELFFSFAEPAEIDNNEKNQEVCFYVDENPNLTIKVESSAATTFRMGEEIVISDDKISVGLRFDVHSGEGEFFGHIMKANRPSQLTTTGVNRFSVFDWQIFLRTLRRSDNCTVKATLRIVGT
jgi:hypothetical protein